MSNQLVVSVITTPTSSGTAFANQKPLYIAPDLNAWSRPFIILTKKKYTLRPYFCEDV